MPILFQYRNIMHFLGMYFTKQGDQEIICMYLIAQQNNNGAPQHTHTQLPTLPVGALLHLSGLLDCA